MLKMLKWKRERKEGALCCFICFFWRRISTTSPFSDAAIVRPHSIDGAL